LRRKKGDSVKSHQIKIKDQIVKESVFDISLIVEQMDECICAYR